MCSVTHFQMRQLVIRNINKKSNSGSLSQGSEDVSLISGDYGRRFYQPQIRPVSLSKQVVSPLLVLAQANQRIPNITHLINSIEEKYLTEVGEERKKGVNYNLDTDVQSALPSRLHN